MNYEEQLSMDEILKKLSEDSKTVILDDYSIITKTLYSSSRRLGGTTTINSILHQYFIDDLDNQIPKEPISQEAQECIDTINACVEHSTKLVFGPTDKEIKKVNKLLKLEAKQHIKRGWKK
jgi:hypothetical protein